MGIVEALNSMVNGEWLMAYNQEHGLVRYIKSGIHVTITIWGKKVIEGKVSMQEFEYDRIKISEIIQSTTFIFWLQLHDYIILDDKEYKVTNILPMVDFDGESKLFVEVYDAQDKVSSLRLYGYSELFKEIKFTEDGFN